MNIAYFYRGNAEILVYNYDNPYRCNITGILQPNDEYGKMRMCCDSVPIKNLSIRSQVKIMELVDKLSPLEIRDKSLRLVGKRCKPEVKLMFI